jgi:hypothetical protein
MFLLSPASRVHDLPHTQRLDRRTHIVHPDNSRAILHRQYRQRHTRVETPMNGISQRMAYHGFARQSGEYQRAETIQFIEASQ